MRTGFNADCIVLHLYLFRVKNVSKQFLPREEAVCVSFVLKSVFFRAVLLAQLVLKIDHRIKMVTIWKFEPCYHKDNKH